MEMSPKSCFQPLRRPKHSLVRISPPLVHMTSYVTGGLRALYQQIGTAGVPSIHEFGAYTDSNGCFRPHPSMPQLAYRYQYLQVIGKGQSSILIKAQDKFCGDAVVAIKVLHTNYHMLGAQETDCIRRINQADPYDVSSTLRLLTTFTFDEHYCMVFEYLHPQPLSGYFKTVPQCQILPGIRKAAVRILQSLGFLQRENVIHADLKPENILCKTEGCLDQLKVVDFGNAIHCVHDEVSLYYDDFELQTLLYRAPEVMFGLPFGTEIDMWSLGCVLAELYMGKPLFFGKNKQAIMQEIVNLLGPFPKDLFQRGKFFEELKSFTGKASQPDATLILMKRLETKDYAFANFLSGMLKYSPGQRISWCQAARCTFLAPELGLRYLMPQMEDGSTDTYPQVLMSGNYQHTPHVDHNYKRQHLSSLDLLHTGTCDLSNSQSMDCSVKNQKKVAEVQPVQRNTPSPTEDQSSFINYRPSSPSHTGFRTIEDWEHEDSHRDRSVVSQSQSVTQAGRRVLTPIQFNGNSITLKEDSSSSSSVEGSSDDHQGAANVEVVDLVTFGEILGKEPKGASSERKNKLTQVLNQVVHKTEVTESPDAVAGSVGMTQVPWTNDLRCIDTTRAELCPDSILLNLHNETQNDSETTTSAESTPTMSRTSSSSSKRVFIFQSDDDDMETVLNPFKKRLKLLQCKRTHTATVPKDPEKQVKGQQSWSHSDKSSKRMVLTPEKGGTGRTCEELMDSPLDLSNHDDEVVLLEDQDT